MKNKNLFVIVLFLLALVACVPVSASVTTHTPSQTPVPACSVNDVIEKLKKEVSYDEYALSYTTVMGYRHLFFWIVDPSLNSLAKEHELEANLDLAIKHSVELAHTLNQADTCTAYLFATINPIVVDKNYNKWLSGTIDVRDLPAHAELTDKDAQRVRDSLMNLSGIWQRETIPDIQNVPSDSCPWNMVLENISRRFSPEPLNAYYLFVDNTGISFVIQYQAKSKDEETEILQIANKEVFCIRPSVDVIIVNLVDEEGKVISTKQFPVNP